MCHFHTITIANWQPVLDTLSAVAASCQRLAAPTTGDRDGGRPDREPGGGAGGPPPRSHHPPIGMPAAQQSAAQVSSLLGGPPSSDRRIQDMLNDLLGSKSRPELWEVMRSLKEFLGGDRNVAKAFFAERPGLTKAVFQAQVLLGEWEWCRTHACCLAVMRGKGCGMDSRSKTHLGAAVVFPCASCMDSGAAVAVSMGCIWHLVGWSVQQALVRAVLQAGSSMVSPAMRCSSGSTVECRCQMAAAGSVDYLQQCL